MKMIFTVFFLMLMGGIILPAEEKSPAELVKQLGDQKYELRQNAMDELKKSGFKARDDVRKALSSDDPEVKERARELWKSLKWMVFENAGQDIYQSVSKMANRDADVEIWGNLYRVYGCDIIYIIMEMRSDKKLSDAGIRGFKYLLEKSDLAELSAKISGCKVESTRMELVKFIKSVMPENMNTELSVKMLKLLKQFWLYEDAVEFGKAAWISWKNDKLIAETAEAVRLGMMGKEIWEHCIREIEDERDKSSREILAAFYISLAGELDRKDKIKEVLGAIGGKIEDKSTLQRVCEILLKNGQYEELMKLAADRKEGIFIYMRIIVLSRTGKSKEAEEGWKNILATEYTEEELFTLGEFISEKGKDRLSEQIWWKIIELGKGKKDSIYVINALLRAAPYLEERGEYGKAADMLERVMKSSKEIGGFYFSSKVAGEDAEKSLRKKLEDLRKKEKEKGRGAEKEESTLETTIE
ncbi:MAG TPA: hypothetical protein DCZ94_04390 [Lentisphaeria bacterium]|nr:MAG: hypothetical protein A2X48_20380 [Lentisphaerae bacterium GWF2_49_21]HBC86175.1 hypothetical protein [Lentisphaeria bacterium]